MATSPLQSAGPGDRGPATELASRDGAGAAGSMGAGPSSAPPPGEDDGGPHGTRPTPTGRYLALLALGAIGVVYGDIGTSPLYALKECFHGAHGVRPTPGNVLGVLSLVFWAMTITVTLKYLVFVLRADNQGEGGVLSLTSLATPIRPTGRTERRWLVILGLFGAALLYGDGIITPAISVLSAVEGISVVTPRAEPFVLPLAVAIITGLFAFQKGGTARAGKVFGPVMVLWFLSLAALGVAHAVRAPEVLGAVDPRHGVRFFAENGRHAFLVLGSVVLVVTGGESLYTDLGHFGRRPIRVAWFSLVYPALLLNYAGQGALLLRDPSAAEHPFFRLAPGWLLAPLVALATMATVIASQAVISGAFSVTLQAIQLGFLPRLRVRHTSAHEFGQIYVPAVNWALLAACVALVVGFRTSSALAAAYGIAVTGTMVITSTVFGVVARERWGWPLWRVVPLVALFLTIELAFLGANLLKLLQGGWLPLLVGGVMFTLMSTWKRGRRLVYERTSAVADALPGLMARVKEGERSGEIARVPGTAVFLSGTPGGAPAALLHNLKHNRVVHAHTVLATVKTAQTPSVAPADRVRVEPIGDGFYRAEVRFGFMEDPHLAPALEADEVQATLAAHAPGLEPSPRRVTYFTNRDRVWPTSEPGMALWREKLFAAMSRASASAADYFGLPPERTVEIGNVVKI
jgi:KUP system potassium uptake protein